MNRIGLMWIVVFSVLAFAPLAAAQEGEKLNVERELMRAEAQLNSGAYADARDTAEAVLEQDAENGNAWLLLGRAQMFLDQSEKALASYDKAEEAGVDPSTYRGAAHYRAGDFEKAKTALMKALQADKRDADAYYLLGLVNFKQENFEPAREALARARQFDDSLAAQSLLFSGISAARLEDKETAKDELSKVVKMAPGSDLATAAQRALNNLDGGKPYIATVSLMNQFDSNVLLVPVDGGFFTPAEISQRDGNRLVLAGKVGWTPRMGKFSAEASYGLYQSLHWTNRDTLKRLDVSNHAFVLGGGYSDGPHKAQLPYSVSISLLNTFDDATKFSLVNRVSPAYSYTTGAHTFGVQDDLGYENFAAEPVAFTVDGEEIEQVRDNLFNRLSLFYRLGFLGGRGHLTPSATYSIADATGTNSWDQSGWKVALQSGLPLGETWTWNAGFSWGARSYANPFPDLTDDGGIDFTDRDDRTGAVNTSFAYTAASWGAFAGLNYSRNLSSIDDFDYVRAIYSIGAQARF